LEKLWKRIKRRRAHEQFMRPRGFNRQRLRLIEDRNPPARMALPNRLELALSCAVAAALVAAWFWWI
jgi:hypothetical protein